MNLNVYLTFSSNIVYHVIKISSLAKDAEIKTFMMEGFPVHLTLYLTEYSSEMLDEILQKVEQISKTKQIDIVTTNLERIGTWLFLQTVKSPELLNLHKECVRLLSPLRDKAMKKPEWLSKKSPKHTSFLQYGSPNVDTFFDPHITLLANGDPEKVDTFIKQNPLKPIVGKAIALAIGEADKNGQITKEIVSWKLRI